MIPLNDLVARFRAEDSFSAIELICRETDALAAAKVLGEAANHFYWKEKDLASSVMMGLAGVHHALAAATQFGRGNDPLALELRAQAKALAYNLSSFTWPGWDEPGIVIGPSELAIGLDAAKVNLRLGRELNKGPLPMSRASWMLAAHQLAAARYTDAQRNFATAGQEADAAGSEPDRWLCVGFGVLNEMLAGGNDSAEAKTALTARLKDALNRLRGLEQGEMFVQQIETARRVFGKGINL